VFEKIARHHPILSENDVLLNGRSTTSISTYWIGSRRCIRSAGGANGLNPQ
jgi:hypothetical protein